MSCFVRAIINPRPKRPPEKGRASAEGVHCHLVRPHRFTKADERMTRRLLELGLLLSKKPGVVDLHEPLRLRAIQHPRQKRPPEKWASVRRRCKLPPWPAPPLQERGRAHERVAARVSSPLCCNAEILDLPHPIFIGLPHLPIVCLFLLVNRVPAVPETLSRLPRCDPCYRRKKSCQTSAPTRGPSAASSSFGLSTRS